MIGYSVTYFFANVLLLRPNFQCMHAAFICTIIQYVRQETVEFILAVT